MIEAEGYLERCADMKVDIEASGAIDGVRTSRGLSKVHLEVRNEKRQQHFSALRHKKKTILWQADVALQESWQNEWHDIKYQRILANDPLCPERTLKTPLPQQRSCSSRDEDDQWIAWEDRRRRRVAIEEAAKRMLRYLEDSEDFESGRQ